MNELIKKAFKSFKVNNKDIPVKFMYYNGHETSYVVYSRESIDEVISGDDEIIGYVEYYDFDIYAKTNYKDIVEGVKQVLKEKGFVWQPSKSRDDYEVETKYYHTTLNFAIYREEN